MKIRCDRADCFRNNGGKTCELLREELENPITCPFFMTPLDAADKQAKAHRRLIELGRFDLVKKFELNPQRNGSW